MPTPLLIISDSPSCTSGLGRIARDLASRIHSHLPDLYRVGTVGYGGPGSQRFPWPDYHVHSIESWQLPELPSIAHDFAGEEELILLVVWDASRVGWLAHPQVAPPYLRKWLESAKLRKWTYTPVDAEGPHGKLSVRLDTALKGFERVLNYSKWSAGVTGYPDYLPHGIDAAAFIPRDKREAKRKFIADGFVGLKEDSFLVGIVATNQARKDWALGIQTVRLLLNRGLDVRLWCHVDTIERYWDLGALVVDYNLQGRVVITTSNFSDEQMNWLYSACDVTLGIGKGEGFGFPIFESIFSGTPCIHGDYGGAAELLPAWMKVPVSSWYYEGPYCCKRPVFNAELWAEYAQGAVDHAREGCATAHCGQLSWTDLWPRWERWLRNAIHKPEPQKKKLERVK